MVRVWRYSTDGTWAKKWLDHRCSSATWMILTSSPCPWRLPAVFHDPVWSIMVTCKGSPKAFFPISGLHWWSVNPSCLKILMLSKLNSAQADEQLVAANLLAMKGLRKTKTRRRTSRLQLIWVQLGLQGYCSFDNLLSKAPVSSFSWCVWRPCLDLCNEREQLTGRGSPSSARVFHAANCFQVFYLLVD